ncbi:MAG: DUF58 domain-containing protein [Saccharospirillum sp.]
MIAALQGMKDRWIERRLPVNKQVRLNQSRIFIVPTWQGLLLLLVAALVLLLAINFESSLNYALGFWLVAMVWAAVHFTYRSLSGLVVTARKADLVEAGLEADYQIVLGEDDDRYRGPIDLSHPDWGLVSVEVTGKATLVLLSRPLEQRGAHPLPRFRLESRYPFGLVVAWSYIQLDLTAWAYPVARQADVTPAGRTGENEGLDDQLVHAGSEDFHALRSYQPGDALHRMHWPSFSRDQWMVKSFVDYQGRDEWLDWQAFPQLVDEERLSALAWQIEQCIVSDTPYGLRLPGVELQPDKGSRHDEACRRALAEYGRRP